MVQVTSEQERRSRLPLTQAQKRLMRDKAKEHVDATVDGMVAYSGYEGPLHDDFITFRPRIQTALLASIHEALDTDPVNLAAAKIALHQSEDALARRLDKIDMRKESEKTLMSLYEGVCLNLIEFMDAQLEAHKRHGLKGL